jgi:3-methyl-2-oxobutanoate hydroxymethyltransferase
LAGRSGPRSTFLASSPRARGYRRTGTECAGLVLRGLSDLLDATSFTASILFAAARGANAAAVKLEGGVVMAATIAKLVQVGIPVMGHIGLTPQSVHSFGGYKIQGKDKRRREAVLRDALAVEEAGAFSVVLEGMPLDLAREITERLAIPTIGIGAGVNCDGQVLVIHDMLGLFDDFRPKFVKRYAELKNVINGAVKNFINEVRQEKFPGEEHSFK